MVDKREKSRMRDVSKWRMVGLTLVVEQSKLEVKS